jgi:hypothetical protein
MPATALIGVTWHKSRCSSPQGECVELARLATGDVAVRNSHHPDGPALVYTRAEIEAFIQGVLDGDFDQFVGVGDEGGSRLPSATVTVTGRAARRRQMVGNYRSALSLT